MVKYVVYMNGVKSGGVKTTKLLAEKASTFLRKKYKGAKITIRKIPSPKFKIGDNVFSWQNPTVKRSITMFRESEDAGFEHQYKVSLRDKGGYSYSSKWMRENSLKKTKLRAK